MVLYSHAKLNLYLAVLNKRKDSYHNIKTLFERIDLKDKIILKKLPGKTIKIICRHPRVPTGKTNLVYAAAHFLQEKFGIQQGVEIKITKNIPVGAGLGGGSSNAATVLMGLNKLWKLRLNQEKLAKIAARIGSDVPFFICRSSFAQGEGRGERIRELKVLKRVKLTHILVVPNIHVSTPLIYGKWDEYSGLTTPKLDVKIPPLVKKDFRLFWKPEFAFNSLEAVTTRLYPEVNRVKVALGRLNLKTILMSGSGPAVFATISSKKEAAPIAKRLKAINKSWQVFVVETA